MTDKIRKWFNDMEDSQNINGNGSIYVSWVRKGKGFGEFYLSIDKDSGKLYLDDEIMGKDFVKKVLCALVDEAEIRK